MLSLVNSIRELWNLKIGNFIKIFGLVKQIFITMRYDITNVLIYKYR